MTLTSILPTLRASIPDPLRADCWPAATSATVTDVLVAGVSMTHLAGLCGTPCVHVAPMPATRLAQPPRMGSVVVATVTAVRACGTGRREVALDAGPGLVDARWSEARLVGRASSARSARATLQGSRSDVVLVVPGDVRAGDLLAVPCRGWVTVRDVRAPARSALPPVSRDVVDPA